MNKLNQAYEAIEMLKTLGLPVSSEQVRAIAMMERQYLMDDVVPKIKQEVEPLVSKMHNTFRLKINYSNDCGLDIHLVDRKSVQERQFPIDSAKAVRREKKYIIRVVYPEGRAICSKIVWETLVDVVKYAGPEKVRSLGIYQVGDNLVSPNLNPNERYRAGQKDVGDGLYVSTFSSTDAKYDQIRRINKELGLGLKIEKVLL